VPSRCSSVIETDCCVFLHSRANAEQSCQWRRGYHLRCFWDQWSSVGTGRGCCVRKGGFLPATGSPVACESVLSHIMPSGRDRCSTSFTCFNEVIASLPRLYNLLYRQSEQLQPQFCNNTSLHSITKPTDPASQPTWIPSRTDTDSMTLSTKPSALCTTPRMEPRQTGSR
jgi:hypothetical protein